MCYNSTTKAASVVANKGAYIMQTTTKFISDDGIEFNSADACLNHEGIYKTALAIIAQLEVIPNEVFYKNDTLFIKKMGYIQQDIKKVLELREEFLNLIDNNYWADTCYARVASTHYGYTQYDYVYDTYKMSRTTESISEKCPRTIAKLWSRFTCIDKEGREWVDYLTACHSNCPSWTLRNIRINQE